MFPHSLSLLGIPVKVTKQYSFCLLFSEYPVNFCVLSFKSGCCKKMHFLQVRNRVINFFPNASKLQITF